MNRVEEIGAAIRDLPQEDFQRIAQWIRELDQKHWDEQLDRDAAAGKLDLLFDEAESEGAQGLARDSPPRR